MFLKNYTSNVPVSETIAKIEKTLIRAGVCGVMKEYSASGKVLAVTFHIEIGGAKMSVRLPADESAAIQALWLDYAEGERLTSDGNGLSNSRKSKRKHDFIEQGQRTAWKLVQDWIEVQVSMIQMKQADFRQVFMPYIWDGEKTFYQRIEAQKFRALLPNPTPIP